MLSRLCCAASNRHSHLGGEYGQSQARDKGKETSRVVTLYSSPPSYNELFHPSRRGSSGSDSGASTRSAPLPEPL
ncbi:hypothetical protein [Acerihabitans arboris]|uniref:Uncharacterized protein n=1 Tax=Acerihabitans arboris TaxID=2691583 RepID=A0A845SFZ7_9GAMM|nr:hypothetical protein [Acerihabitans arboris]NDL62302.1 hypothetical protein [Acerihabitans arboris]